MYSPAITSARAVREHSLGPGLLAVLFTDIDVPAGGIEYAHVLVVFREGEPEPRAYITSEVNSGGAPSHFLCAFVAGMHRNYGADDKWSDISAFEQAALERARLLRDAGELEGDRPN